VRFGGFGGLGRPGLNHTPMTITDTQPDRTDAAEVASPMPAGLAGVLGSGDHKVVGRVFLAGALVVGVVSAVALALGLLGNLSGGGLFGADVNLQLMTAGQFGLVFGFALPAFAGLGLLVVPLQVGAASVAFPRAAALGAWTWLVGIVVGIVAVAIDGGIGGGNARAIDLTFTAVVMTIAGLLVAAVCIATTVVTLRAPGMTLDRVPMFSWSMLAASGIWLLSWPVLVGNLVLVRTDLVNAQLLFGSATDQWSAIAWSFMQPQIYVLAIPVLGVIGDVVPALVNRRQAGRNVVLAAIGAFAALSIGSWTPLIQADGVWTGPLFVVVSFAIILPLLAAAGGWGSMLAEGKPRPSVPLVAVTVAILLLVLATVVGALFAIGPLDLQVLTIGDSGTPMAALGQALLTLGAVVAGVVAASVWWSSKISGRAFPGPLGNLAALATLGGGALGGLGLVLAGASARFTALEGAVDAFVVVSVIGAVLLAGALALSALGLVGARGTSDPDPWGHGQTLEWLTASPPAGPVEELPVVTSAEPLVDARGGDADDSEETA
jgi:heme/copper-type cytochrome/quinol oxidase subunit 1